MAATAVKCGASWFFSNKRFTFLQKKKKSCAYYSFRKTANHFGLSCIQTSEEFVSSEPWFSKLRLFKEQFTNDKILIEYHFKMKSKVIRKQ